MKTQLLSFFFLILLAACNKQSTELHSGSPVIDLSYSALKDGTIAFKDLSKGLDSLQIDFGDYTVRLIPPTYIYQTGNIKYALQAKQKMVNYTLRKLKLV